MNYRTNTPHLTRTHSQWITMTCDVSRHTRLVLHRRMKHYETDWIRMFLRVLLYAAFLRVWQKSKCANLSSFFIFILFLLSSIVSIVLSLPLLFLRCRGCKLVPKCAVHSAPSYGWMNCDELWAPWALWDCVGWLCGIVWHCALHSEPRRPPSKLWLCWIRSGARLPARHGPGVHGFGTQTPSEYSIWYVSSDVCCCIDGMNEPAYSGMRVRSSKLGARMCIFPSAPTREQNIIWYWSARNPLRLSQLWSSIFFNLYINIYKYTWEWLTSLYHKNGLHEQGRL